MEISKMIYPHELQEAKREPGKGVISEPPPEPLLQDVDWKPMEWYLADRGISFNSAKYNGCYPIWRKGFRLYIPAVSRIDGHNYWQARSMDGHELRYDSPFGPRRDALIVMKNLYPSKKRTSVAIVEGPLDALAAAEVPGFTGIALMGIKPPEEALLHLLYRLRMIKPQAILCVADRDSVGDMAKIQGWLAMKGYGSDLRIPEGFKDVCEGTQEQREELLQWAQ